MRKFGLVSLGALLVAGLVIAAAGTAVAHGRSDAPVVSSVSPDHGSVNGGTFVDIHGKNLDSFSAVYFNGVQVTASLRSNNTIEATSPAGTGTVPITVQTPDGTSASGPNNQFTYVTSPVIQNMSPRSGATIGGNRVTISGSDFLAVSSVDFGSQPGTGLDVVSSTVLTVITPANPVGPVAVTLLGSPDGTSPTPDPADVYTYALRVPKVTGLSTSSGTEGTPVNIYGTGFTKITGVAFGGTEVGSFTRVNSREITTTAPAGTGTVDVTVTNKDGTSVINEPDDEFTYENIVS
jgi:IPT/TIG domain